MGASGKEPEFPERVTDLASQIRSEFIDEEITQLLSEKKLVRLGELIEDEDVIEEEFSNFLNDSVPGFDEIYQEKVLDNKVVIEGRIKQLRILTVGETDLQLSLDTCEVLIEKGEWLKIQDILVTEFAEY